MSASGRRVAEAVAGEERETVTKAREAAEVVEGEAGEAVGAWCRAEQRCRRGAAG
jgi:hypothetical protein